MKVHITKKDIIELLLKGYFDSDKRYDNLIAIANLMGDGVYTYEVGKECDCETNEVTCGCK